MRCVLCFVVCDVRCMWCSMCEVCYVISAHTVCVVCRLWLACMSVVGWRMVWCVLRMSYDELCWVIVACCVLRGVYPLCICCVSCGVCV